MPKTSCPARVSSNPAIQGHYELCLKNGCTPRLAEMLAFRQAPRGMTDDVFLADMPTIGKMYGPVGVEKLVAAARRQGYSPNVNDVYLSSVAKDFGDPQAFLRHGQGLDRVKRNFEATGRGIEGAVNVKSRPGPDPLERPKKKRLHANIVERKLRETLMYDPASALKDHRELREEIIDKHGSIDP